MLGKRSAFLCLVHGLGKPVVAGGGGRVGPVAGEGTVLRTGVAIGRGGAAVFDVGMGFHGEGDAVAFEIDLGDGDVDFLADFDDFGSISDEVIGELGNVDESVLMDANIDEGTEGGDVGDDAGEFHSWLEIGWFFHAIGEAEVLELFARIAAGFGELGEDVLESGEADIFADVLFEIDFLAGGFVS